VDKGKEGGVVFVPFVQLFVLADFFVGLPYCVGVLAGDDPGEELVEAGEEGGGYLKVDEGFGFDDFELHRWYKIWIFFGGEGGGG
jgi:hypothetical protein